MSGITEKLPKGCSFFWNELIISPIHDKNGQLTHFIGVQNDVTDREEARREKAAKQIELEKTLETLKETELDMVKGSTIDF